LSKPTILTFKDVVPFDLEAIADGGQAFRWEQTNDGEYLGVIGNAVINARQTGDNLEIVSNLKKENEYKIRDYFDLDRDYSSIEKKLLCFEELQPAVNFCTGNRILHQDPWETTISFIISANNSIRNIKNTIRRLCESYGDQIQFNEKIYYTFPVPERLAGLSEDEIRQTRCGYRAKYIKETSCMIADGKVDIFNLHKLTTKEIRKQLKQLPGVGKKVADCILLFSMRKFDAFPIDVWIKRVLEHIYFSGKQMPISKLQEYAENRFGDLAGFAQQYLFHYTRSCWKEIQNKNN